MTLERALELASQDYHVFPLIRRNHNGKISFSPAIYDMEANATKDPDKIREMWTSGTFVSKQKRGGKTATLKAGNYDVAVQGIGIVILDVDYKEQGKNGYLSLMKLEKDIGGLPPTRVVKTPSGGAHFIYRLPPGMKVGNHHLGRGTKKENQPYPHIDVRGSGGYTVAPGTERHDGTYYVVKDLEPAMCPVSLIDLLTIKEIPQSAMDDFGAVTDDGTSEIQTGGRDETVFKMCCGWRGASIPRADALVKLKAVYDRLEQREGDIFTWEMCLAKLESAYRLPEGNKLDQQVAATPGMQTAKYEDMKSMVARYIYIESKSRVADRLSPRVFTFEEFTKSKAAYIEEAGTKANGDPLYKPSSELWLKSKSRQTVFDTTYYPKPGEPIVKHWASDLPCFNTYLPPILPQVTYDPKVIQPMMDHIKFLVPDPDQRKTFIEWLAFCLRYPWIKPYGVLIITPNYGVGKGVLFEMMARVMGMTNVRVVSKEELEKDSTFNDFLAGSTMVLWDEIKVATFGYGKLKPYISEGVHMINSKYGSKRQEMTYCSHIMFSNHLDAVDNLDVGDRRLFIIDNRAERKDPDYYIKLFRLVKESPVMAAHFSAFLQQVDLSNFDAFNPPMTDIKRDMTMASKQDYQVLIETVIDSKSGPCRYDIVTPNLVHYHLDQKDRAPKTMKQTGLYLNKINASYKLKKYSFQVDPVANQAPELNATQPRNLVCIRNHEKWMNATTAMLRLEYLKAREATITPDATDQDIINRIQPDLKEA